MAFASGSRVRLAYVPEVTYNTTPATPAMIELPKQSITLDLSKETFNDPTITSDRMEADERHGNITVEGEVVSTLQHAQFDAWLEAALGGTWTANVLKVGTTPRSFTIEQGFLDIAQYRRFTGVRINSYALEVNPGSIVSATWGLMGAGMTTAQAQLAAPTAPLANKQGMSHIGGSISVGGSNVVCTGATLNVDNGMTAARGIGSSTAYDTVWSESTVTGSCTFYFEDLVQYNRFLNETTTSIVITLSDGTNTLTHTIPKAKFNTASLPVPNSGLLFVTMAFKGLKDATSGTTLQITRSAVA